MTVVVSVPSKITSGDFSDVSVLSTANKGQEIVWDGSKLVAATSTYDVKGFGALGNGTTNDAAAISAAVTAAVAVGGAAVVFPAGTYYIDTNTTIPATVTLVLNVGAILKPNTGKTLTVNAQIDAGLYQIFSFAAGGTVAGNHQTAYPEWFGALGDGATDDILALHKARDFAGIGGQVIGKTAATYAIASQLTLNVASQTWDFTGSKVFLKNASNVNMCRVTGAGTSVIGGDWNGNTANQTTALTGAGILIQASNCVVDGSYVHDTHWAGIYITVGDFVVVRNCRVENTDYIGIFVVVVSASITGCWIENNKVDRSALTASSMAQGGIQIHGTSSFPVTDAKIQGNAVYMPHATGISEAICIEVFGNIVSATISGNSTFDGYMGISMNSTQMSTITGNVVRQPFSIGIEFAESHDNVVNGNAIYGNGLLQYGTYISGLAHPNTRNIFSNNIVIDCVIAGIYAIHDPDHLTLSSNQIQMTAATDAIRLYNADNVSIIGNNILQTTATNEAIYLETCSNVSITGNSGDGSSVVAAFVRNVDSPFVALGMNDLRNYTRVIDFSSSGTLDYFSGAGNTLSGISSIYSVLAGAIGDHMRWIGNTGDNSMWQDVHNLLKNIRQISGSGAPGGVYSAGPGSLFLRSDGGASKSVYIKESGTGTGGWVALTTASSVWIHNGTWSIDDVIFTNSPTLGAEKLTDGAFENWISPTNATSWTESLTGTSTVNQESSIVHGGSNSLRFDVDGSTSIVSAFQTILTTTGFWLLVSWWGRSSASGKSVAFSGGAVRDPGTTWTQYFDVFRSASGSPSPAFQRSTGSASGSLYVDDASIKAITSNTLYIARNDVVGASQVSADTTTLVIGTQIGVVAKLDSVVNPQNLIVVYIDGTNIKMDKLVGGTWTNLISTPVTFVSGATIAIKPNGSNVWQAWYNGAQKGTDQTVSDAGIVAGAFFGGFSTYGNTLTNPTVS